VHESLFRALTDPGPPSLDPFKRTQHFIPNATNPKPNDLLP